jgi:TonB family protein
VELDVTLRSNGELLAVAVARSSGHKILDAAAVKAAEGAFSGGLPGSIDPVALAEFGGEADYLVVPVPVSFKLTE